MKKVFVALIVLILLSVLILNGCEREMSIKEIHQNSEKLLDKEVITSGTVVRSTKVFTFASFLIEDETGENSILVVVAADSVLPEKGMKMWVKGILSGDETSYKILATEVKEI